MKQVTRTSPGVIGAVLLILIGLGTAQPGWPAADAEPAPQSTAEPAIEAATALATFDQVWGQVRAQYFDFGRIESDWEQALIDLRPLAGQAVSASELREVLHELLALIGESHFTVLSAELMGRLDDLPNGQRPVESGPGSTGLSVRLVDGRFLVSDVRPGDSAWEAGIRRGWELTAIDGHELSEQLKQWRGIEDESDARRARTMLEVTLHSLLAYPDANRSLSLVFRDEGGLPRERTLSPASLGVELVRLGNLPPMPFEFQLERIDHDDHCVMWLAFSAWVPELNEAISRQREQLVQCDGLVIDLRGNLGGVMSTMLTLSADLFEQPATLGSLLRADGQMDFRVLPRRVAMDGSRLEPFAGPIAVLIDSLSASTSEMFASGMQATGRGRLFGETSAGMALPAQILPLASGDFLMYAFADYRDSGGRRIEGVGAVPDQAVPLTLSEPDPIFSPPLAAALDWISIQLGQASPATPAEQPQRVAH